MAGNYGNIMHVDTTGCSDVTARQDGGHEKGVSASHQLARTDLGRLNKYKPQIFEAAKVTNMDAAVIAAIISRESRAGAALANDGTGDHGNGFGLMQVDKRWHQPAGGPYSTEHLQQGAQILQNMVDTVLRNHPDWSANQALKGGISAYNAGPGNVRTYDRMDVGTTGNDYANDVTARAQWLKGQGF